MQQTGDADGGGQDLRGMHGILPKHHQHDHDRDQRDIEQQRRERRQRKTALRVQQRHHDGHGTGEGEIGQHQAGVVDRKLQRFAPP